MQRNSWLAGQRSLTTALIVLALLAVTCGAYWVQEYKSGIIWPEPAILDPGPVGGVPADAIVLFDGSDLSQWDGGEAWKIEAGAATAQKNGIRSKRAFGDCQLHLEFATPAVVSGSGQGRGNSGLYLRGKSEVQILDSSENTTAFDGQCGAVYKQQPPMVNACRGPGEWQTYDVIFEAPKFSADGALVKPAYLTVLHNGVLIHNHLKLQGSTSFTAPARQQRHPAKLPLFIQFHGNPTRFRNIWVRENIEPLVGTPPAGGIPPSTVEAVEGVSEPTALPRLRLFPRRRRPR